MTVLRLKRDQARQKMRALESRPDAATIDNPFGTAAWWGHFLGEVGQPDWDYVLVDHDGAAVLPLYAESGRPGRLKALANYYTSLYAAFPFELSAAGRHACIAELARSQPAIETIDLAPLSEADAAAVAHGFRQAGWYTRQYDCFGNWFMPCEGLSFSDYMAQRPSQLVNTWQRKSKRFRADSAEFRLQMVTMPEELPVAMQAYRHVYEKSWKQAEPYPNFVADWARICAERGWLRLGLAWAGDVPIAAQFWFTCGGRAYIFKLAYDEDHSKLSAGTVLSALMFQHSLDVDRVVEIDYLTGDDAYKQSWVTQRRRRVGVLACNPRTVHGAARAVREALSVASAPARRWLAARAGAQS